jgi:uncharacterized protein
MHYLLLYELAPDYEERRATYRDEHLRLAWRAHEKGSLLLGGAVGEPIESAALLFKGESPDAARAFAEADPYVTDGLVASWRVLPWHTVVGEDAAEPKRPNPR